MKTVLHIVRSFAVPLLVTVSLGVGCLTSVLPANAIDSPASSSWSLSPDKGSYQGRTKVSLTPPKFANEDSTNQISAGISHSLALDSDGNAYAWGNNSRGRLGDGTKINDRSRPAKVARPANVSADFKFTQVSAGTCHSLALGSDGNAYAWGYNCHGNLGDGTTEDHNRPVRVIRPSNVAADFRFMQISAGGQHSLALGSDGFIYAWGGNNHGQLGDGTSSQHCSPVRVTRPNSVSADFRFTQISAGEQYSLALGSDGQAYSWGYNNYGYLGNGTKEERYRPGKVSTPEGTPSDFRFTQVSAGINHSLALSSYGTIYAWGGNAKGKLGDGTDSTRYVPVMVLTPRWAHSGFRFTQVSAGGQHSSALGSDGNAYSWGYNDSGNLGDGTRQERYRPGKVSTPEGTPSDFRFTQISAGCNHSLATGSDTSIYAWGSNDYGKLGDGTTDYRLLPVRVRGIVVAGSSDSVVQVRQVTFDGVPSVGSPQKELDGTWSVVTPAHARGPVDVAVTWSLDGVEQVTHLQYTYTQETHTVTFCPIEDDPSSCSTQTVYDSERAVRPADPTRVDYVFDGWFDKDTNTAYDFDQPITADMTIVGHWTHIR